MFIFCRLYLNITFFLILAVSAWPGVCCPLNTARNFICRAANACVLLRHADVQLSRFPSRLMFVAHITHTYIRLSAQHRVNHVLLRSLQFSLLWAFVPALRFIKIMHKKQQGTSDAVFWPLATLLHLIHQSCAQFTAGNDSHSHIFGIVVNISRGQNCSASPTSFGWARNKWWTWWRGKINKESHKFPVLRGIFGRPL